jgi:archaellum component FlaC
LNKAKIFGDKLVKGNIQPSDFQSLFMAIGNAHFAAGGTSEEIPQIEGMERAYGSLMNEYGSRLETIGQEATPPSQEEGSAGEIRQDSPDSSGDGEKEVIFSEDVEHELIDLVGRQKAVVERINNRVGTVLRNYSKVRKEWNEYVKENEREFTSTLKDGAQRVSKSILELEYGQIEKEKGFRALVDNLNSTCTRLGVDILDLESVDFLGQIDEDQNGGLGGIDVDTLEPPPEVEEGASNEVLQKESQVLRSQLENARDLIKSSNKQVAVLRALLDESGTYNDRIESESSEQKENIRTLNAKVTDLQSKKDRFEEQMDYANRLLQNHKMELERLQQKYADLKNRNKDLKKELATIKENTLKTARADGFDLDVESLDMSKVPPNLVAAMNAKDSFISSLQKGLEKEQNIADNLKLQLEKIKADEKSNETRQRNMAEKIEHMRSEVAAFRQSNKGMEIKTKVLHANLNESRRTISKLNVENQQIKKDRVQYMNQTNKALVSLKAAAGETRRLNSRVEAEAQQNKQLNRTVAKLKSSEKTLTTTIGKLKNKIDTLAGELKKRIQEADEARGKLAANEMGGHQMKLEELEKKNDQLKAEYKAVEAAYVKKQHEADELKKSLREAEIALTRLKNQVPEKKGA